MVDGVEIGVCMCMCVCVCACVQMSVHYWMQCKVVSLRIVQHCVGERYNKVPDTLMRSQVVDSPYCFLLLAAESKL